MLNLDKIHITNITLLAACECNLNCAYCPIAQSVNSHSKGLMERNVRALQDGTYIKNILATLKRLETAPQQINAIQIWGQEPTLIIHYLTEHWEDWILAFPNLDYFMFSTNGMEHMDDLYDFITTVDKYATNPFTVSIQFSYDGIYGTEVARGGKSNIIKNNLTYLIKKLNGYKLKNVHLDLQGHGVYSLDLAKWLINFENADSYLTSIDDLINAAYNNIANGQVAWGGYALQFQTGGTHSTEDGLIYANSLRHLTYLQNRDSYEYFYQSPGAFVQILGGTIRNLCDIFMESDCQTFDEFVNMFINTPDMEFPGDLHCSTTLQDLKIMYDGTVLMCQNDIYNSQAEDDEFPMTISGQSHKYHLNHYNKVNFITASDEEIQRYIDYIYDIRYYGSHFVHHSLCNLMYLMAQVGQIAPSYQYNFNKIKRHAFLMMFLDSCFHSTIGATGSTFLRDINIIRLLCNGVLDEAEKIFVKQNDDIIVHRPPRLTDTQEHHLC